MARQPAHPVTLLPLGYLRVPKTVSVALKLLVPGFTFNLTFCASRCEAKVFGICFAAAFSGWDLQNNGQYSRIILFHTHSGLVSRERLWVYRKSICSRGWKGDNFLMALIEFDFGPTWCRLGWTGGFVFGFCCVLWKLITVISWYAWTSSWHIVYLPACLTAALNRSTFILSPVNILFYFPPIHSHSSSSGHIDCSPPLLLRDRWWWRGDRERWDCVVGN